jgi:uncharacterized DUF497 family protein
VQDGIFEWDASKAYSNFAKHGVTFEEAVSVFEDAFAITIGDPEHSDSEDRFVTIGLSSVVRVLLVVHMECGESIRIISARKATPSEREDYETQF